MIPADAQSSRPEMQQQLLTMFRGVQIGAQSQTAALTKMLIKYNIFVLINCMNANWLRMQIIGWF